MAPDEPPRDIPADPLEQRKRDHLRIVLNEDVGFGSLRTGLDQVVVMPRALPERDLDDVDLSLALWNRTLRVPLLVSCMTGGASEAGPINRALATAAARVGVAFGLGSGRAALRTGDASSYEVRDVAPDALVLANLGAVQLHEHGVDDCRRLVEACEADVLVLHANAVQEAVQPGGDTSFGGLLERVAEVCNTLPVPVVVKEVGFGLSPADVTAWVEAGVSGVDVAGAGGTNWARVEGRRVRRLGAADGGRGSRCPRCAGRGGQRCGPDRIGRSASRRRRDEGALPRRRPGGVRTRSAQCSSAGAGRSDGRRRHGRSAATGRGLGGRRGHQERPRERPARLSPRPLPPAARPRAAPTTPTT